MIFLVITLSVLIIVFSAIASLPNKYNVLSRTKDPKKEKEKEESFQFNIRRDD